MKSLDNKEFLVLGFFQPNIPCLNSKDKVDNKKISKIVYGKKSD